MLPETENVVVGSLPGASGAPGLMMVCAEAALAIASALAPKTLKTSFRIRHSHFLLFPGLMRPQFELISHLPLCSGACNPFLINECPALGRTRPVMAASASINRSSQPFGSVPAVTLFRSV